MTRRVTTRELVFLVVLAILCVFCKADGGQFVVPPGQAARDPLRAHGAFVPKARWDKRLDVGHRDDAAGIKIVGGKVRAEKAVKELKAGGEWFKLELIGIGGHAGLRSGAASGTAAGGSIPVTSDGQGNAVYEIVPGQTLTYLVAEKVRFPNGWVFAPELKMVVQPWVTCTERPADASFTFEFAPPEGAELSWHLQRPLTQADKDRGSVRPEFIVGSYVVKVDGLKTFHLPAPVAIAADGKWIKGTFDAPVKLASGAWLLTKRFPAAWVAAAALPIRFDATFGMQTAGASSALSDLQVFSGPYACNGTVTSMSAYCYKNPAVAFTLGIYSETGALLADTGGGNTPTSAGWSASQNLDTPLVQTGSLALWFSLEPAAGGLYWYYDNEAASTGYRDWAATASPSAGVLRNPIPGYMYPTGGDYHISMKAVYTPAAAGGGAANLTGSALAP